MKRCTRRPFRKIIPHQGCQQPRQQAKQPVLTYIEKDQTTNATPNEHTPEYSAAAAPMYTTKHQSKTPHNFKTHSIANINLPA